LDCRFLKIATPKKSGAPRDKYSMKSIVARIMEGGTSRVGNSTQAVLRELGK